MSSDKCGCAVAVMTLSAGVFCCMNASLYDGADENSSIKCRASSDAVQFDLNNPVTPLLKNLYSL